MCRCSVFQVAIILLSPVIGAKQHVIGRKQVIIYGYGAAIFGCAAFGLLAHVENE